MSSFPEVKAAGSYRSDKFATPMKQFWAACNDGGRAYEPQNPIHREHILLAKVYRKPTSIGSRRDLLTACQKLVRISCPGNREQRQERNDGQRFHARYSCAKLRLKASEFGAFCRRTGETSWRMAARRFHSLRCRSRATGNRPIRRLPRRNRQTRPESPSTSANRPASAARSRRS